MARRAGHRGVPSAFLDDTKEIAVGIFQDDVIGGGRVPPRMPCRTEGNQPFHLVSLLVRVEIQVQPVPPAAPRFPRLERQIWSLPFRIPQHDPAATRRRSGNIVQRLLPERDHALEFVAMNDDGSDSNGW